MMSLQLGRARIEPSGRGLFAWHAQAAPVPLLIGAVRRTRLHSDCILIEVAYAGGLRVSEIVNLTRSDVLPRGMKRGTPHGVLQACRTFLLAILSRPGSRVATGMQCHRRHADRP
jgi:hypothetical protein